MIYFNTNHFFKGVPPRLKISLQSIKAPMDLYALYRHPPVTATEVFRVWCEAQIPAEATVHDIAVLLDTWAREYCAFTIIDGDYHVCWKSPTGTAHDIPYDTLVHWMLCAAVPVKPPEPVSSPPLAPVAPHAPADPPAIELSVSTPDTSYSDSSSEYQSSSDSLSEPKFVPESKPSAPKPRPDTPRPTLDMPLFCNPTSESGHT